MDLDKAFFPEKLLQACRTERTLFLCLIDTHLPLVSAFTTGRWKWPKTLTGSAGRVDSLIHCFVFPCREQQHREAAHQWRMDLESTSNVNPENSLGQDMQGHPTVACASAAAQFPDDTNDLLLLATPWCYAPPWMRVQQRPSHDQNRDGSDVAFNTGLHCDFHLGWKRKLPYCELHHKED
jgi:hypothetical protein